MHIIAFISFEKVRKQINSAVILMRHLVAGIIYSAYFILKRCRLCRLRKFQSFPEISVFSRKKSNYSNICYRNSRTQFSGSSIPCTICRTTLSFRICSLISSSFSCMGKLLMIKDFFYRNRPGRLLNISLRISKIKFFGIQDFFFQKSFPKMDVNVILRMITKKNVANPEKGFPAKSFLTPF